MPNTVRSLVARKCAFLVGKQMWKPLAPHTEFLQLVWVTYSQTNAGQLMLFRLLLHLWFVVYCSLLPRLERTQSSGGWMSFTWGTVYVNIPLILLTNSVDLLCISSHWIQKKKATHNSTRSKFTDWGNLSLSHSCLHTHVHTHTSVPLHWQNWKQVPTTYLAFFQNTKVVWPEWFCWSGATLYERRVHVEMCMCKHGGVGFCAARWWSSTDSHYIGTTFLPLCNPNMQCQVNVRISRRFTMWT